MQSGASASKRGYAAVLFFPDSIVAEWRRGYQFSRFHSGECSFFSGTFGFFRVPEGKCFRPRFFQTGGGKILRTGCREGTDLHAVYFLR